MIAGNEKDGRVRAGARLKRPCQPLPEIWAGIRIIEDITNAEDRVYGVAPRDVEDSANYIHAGARQLLLALLRKRRKAPSENCSSLSERPN
jgi:hypothetical protein